MVGAEVVGMVVTRGDMTVAIMEAGDPAEVRNIKSDNRRTFDDGWVYYQEVDRSSPEFGNGKIAHRCSLDPLNPSW